MWPIKRLEILLGIWILNQNFKSIISLRSIREYKRKLTLFNDFRKKFEGKFFSRVNMASILHNKIFSSDKHFYSLLHTSYNYVNKSLLAGIFLNSYLIRGHCAWSNRNCERNKNLTLAPFYREMFCTLNLFGQRTKANISLLTRSESAFYHANLL